jgi:hypothetical protein
MWRFKRSNQAISLAAPKAMLDSSTTIGEKGPSAVALPVSDRDVEFGINAMVKTLYAGKNSCGGIYDWVDSPPKALSKKISKAHDRVCLPFFSDLHFL